jgi:hypothetical protein
MKHAILSNIHFSVLWHFFITCLITYMEAKVSQKFPSKF